MPKRIQLRRVKGWRIPPGTVKVDRTTKYGNPYKPGDRYIKGFAERTHRTLYGTVRDNAHAVELFRRDIEGRFWGRLDFDRQDLIRLRGKDVGCWCKEGEPCHGDVLIEVANRPLASVPDV